MTFQSSTGIKCSRLLLIIIRLLVLASALAPLAFRAMRSFAHGRVTNNQQNLVTDRNYGSTELNSLSVTVTPTLLHFHGNPTDDGGCSGVGDADVILCGGPFLLPKSALGPIGVAHWNVPSPELNGATDQNSLDPNWIWNLSSPTTIGGDMTVKW